MNYYRKPINKVIDDVKLKMQIGALTLKISENNKKIDDLIKVDKILKTIFHLMHQKLIIMKTIFLLI